MRTSGGDRNRREVVPRFVPATVVEFCVYQIALSAVVVVL